eukprot:1181169-Prorocentrum_minimum.AAC.4
MRRVIDPHLPNMPPNNTSYTAEKGATPHNTAYYYRNEPVPCQNRLRLAGLLMSSGDAEGSGRM